MRCVGFTEFEEIDFLIDVQHFADHEKDVKSEERENEDEYIYLRHEKNERHCKNHHKKSEDESTE